MKVYYSMILEESMMAATEAQSRAELIEKLAEERQMLRSLIDNLPDGIYVKDTQSRFVVANKTVASLMGVKSPEDLIGKTDFDFFAHDLAAKYYEDEQKIIQSGQAIVNEEEPTFDARTGKAGWLLTSKVPWRDRQGKIAGIMGMGRDITQFKQIQDALAAANRELEARVESRTHELSQSKAKLERASEFYRSTLEQITSVVQQGGARIELLKYLEQAQNEFDALG
jgi:PAS domain S-box-containing protein